MFTIAGGLASLYQGIWRCLTGSVFWPSISPAFVSLRIQKNNISGTNDTVIYWKNNTVTTSDDVIVMVLEDYTTALTMTDFEIVWTG